jgi:predicted molibdopterin-dependent oxidoreductase YjgC
LWVFGHDLAKLIGDKNLQQLSRMLKLFVFSGTNENSTATRAHWVLPTAAYVEKDGTFVNFHGQVQRIGRVFPPLPDSREDWNVLMELSRRLDRVLPWRNPEDIFVAVTEAVPAFAGLSYDKIGLQGAAVDLQAREQRNVE